MRTITPGSWVTWQPKGKGTRTYKARVIRLRPDGSLDITDPRNGNTRTLDPSTVKPANTPKSLQ